jgi:D-beta-D-heptose 7-phosphate kinase/D-beta-D-heptose 1-phosphate adenosyltransferase
MSSDKLIQFTEIAALSADLQAQGKKIVFTNGCFDILHAGHVLYLEKARSLGDVLVLGLNSDASVQRLKGNSRPIVCQSERSIVVAGLAAVTYVCIFEEDTPLELIKQVQPDVLVKGGDWHADQIVGADFVMAKGGTVLSLNYEEGISSSSIIDRIMLRNS